MDRSCRPRVPGIAAALGVIVLVLGLAGATLAQTSASKKDPAVLIGPTRVTLQGGKTIDVIAVFRETGRVRVVLEDDTEIILDPAKVVSVVALADLPEPPPAEAKSPAKGGSAPAARKKTGPPSKVHAEPAGNGKTTSSRSAAAAGAVDGAVEEGSAGGGAIPDTEQAKEERRREIEELAGMLQAAIANAALEGPRTGGPDDQGAASPEGEGATLAPAATPAEDAEADGKKVYKPRPEDFDATIPVNKAGYRWLGPKGMVPETPPQQDFPKPAEPTTSLGFTADRWRPKSGYSSTSTWRTPMAPATSFPNRLSGLDLPITSLGPRWWGPTPTAWPSSIFPQAWRPKDGFAETQERKNPPPPPPVTTPSEQK